MPDKTKTVTGKDETSAGATEVNGQLINATGMRENADQHNNSGGNDNAESRKGDKNKKTTSEPDEGKEKAKNRREKSLED